MSMPVRTGSPATMSLPIADIGELEPHQYVGLIDADAIACLNVRLAAEGLLTPVWVKRNGNAKNHRWSVIAGRHRLRAATELGWTEIYAEQRADETTGDDELRRLQLAENLDRRVLRPIERANGIMCRWQEEAVKRGWDIVSHARDLDQITGEACGKVDARTVRRYRFLHDRIVLALPGLFAGLNAHPLGESYSAMKALASIKLVDSRLKAADAVLSRSNWKSIDDALNAVGLAESKGKRVDPDKLRVLMVDTWGKLPLTGQRAFADFLVDAVPKGIAEDLIVGLTKKWVLCSATIWMRSARRSR